MKKGDSIMRKFLNFLDNYFEKIIIVTLMSVMVVAIFYQVIMRYVFSDSPSWTEEITRYAFIWCIYFGVSLGVKMDAHIRVMAAIELLPKKGQKVMMVIADLVFLAFSIFIFCLSIKMTGTIASLGRTSAALEIPMKYIYAALPAGFACIIIRLIQSLIRQVRHFKDETAPGGAQQYEGEV